MFVDRIASGGARIVNYRLRRHCISSVLPTTRLDYQRACVVYFVKRLLCHVDVAVELARIALSAIALLRGSAELQLLGCQQTLT